MGNEPTFPADWDVRTLTEVSIKIQDGTHFSPALGGNEYRYITSRNIGAGHLRLDSVEMISAEEHQKIYRRCDVRFGDLLLTKDGASTGNAAINSFHDEISLLSSVAFIRSNPQRSTEEYILQYLLSTPGRKQIADAMAGNAITRLTLAKIKALMVPMPSVAEQRRIARALRDADDLIATLERLFAKKQAIKQGMMQQLLTGKARLPGFAEPWRKVTLGSLATITGGGTPRSSIPAYWDGGIPWCTPTDVTRETGRYLLQTGRTISQYGLERSAAELLPAGSLLLCTRATIGEVKIAPFPTATNQGFKSLVPRPGVVGEYLYYKVLSLKDDLKTMGTGSTFLEVSGRDIANLRLAVPGVDEQNAIAAVMVDADDEIDCLRRRLKKANATKQGMMQELLTGRTRLSAHEAAA